MKIAIIFFLAALPLVYSHGLMLFQRGALDDENDLHFGNDPDAPNDFFAHFPAGDKSQSPGAGLRSLIRAAQPEGWMPFEPLKSSFKWRVGVCGDELGKPQDHMRGGKYYYDAKISNTYEQGQNIEITMNIVAHHNGFVEMHLCDVKDCDGEISVDCFRNGKCQPLMRAPNPDCDSGMDKKCGPIDPNYPGRWYLPCSTVAENDEEIMGGSKMLYKLPDDVVCEHCVLHWFWTSANVCNPPGVIEYFEGPNGPQNWGNCPGQAGAIGGYTKVQKPCDKDRFPEEYYQCADIAIEPADRDGSQSDPEPEPESEPATPTPTSTPEPAKPTKTPKPDPSSSDDLFMYFHLVADGEVVASLPNGAKVDITNYDKVAVEAVTSRNAKGEMKWYLDGEHISSEFNRPYFMFGNKGDIPNYWKNPIVNQEFELRAEAEGEVLKAKIELTES